MSMWSQSAPKSSMRWASEAKLAKSEESMEGAILGVTAIIASQVRTEQNGNKTSFSYSERGW